MRPGWKISDTNFVYLDGGHYDDIFVDREAGLALKIFRRGNDKAHIRRTFQNERDAYLIACAADQTKNLVPKFYGTNAEIRVEDERSENQSQRYHLELNLQIDFIDAAFQKLGSLDGKEAAVLRSAFIGVGILHLADASVARTDPQSFKVIDFATKEIELWHE